MAASAPLASASARFSALMSATTMRAAVRARAARSALNPTPPAPTSSRVSPEPIRPSVPALSG